MRGMKSAWEAMEPGRAAAATTMRSDFLGSPPPPLTVPARLGTGDKPATPAVTVVGSRPTTAASEAAPGLAQPPRRPLPPSTPKTPSDAPVVTNTAAAAAAATVAAVAGDVIDIDMTAPETTAAALKIQAQFRVFRRKQPAAKRASVDMTTPAPMAETPVPVMLTDELKLGREKEAIQTNKRFRLARDAVKVPACFLKRG